MHKKASAFNGFYVLRLFDLRLFDSGNSNTIFYAALPHLALPHRCRGPSWDMNYPTLSIL